MKLLTNSALAISLPISLVLIVISFPDMNEWLKLILTCLVIPSIFYFGIKASDDLYDISVAQSKQKMQKGGKQR